jgi:hypothetical protein
MSRDPEPELICEEGGDPPCWSHLFGDMPDDSADGDEIDVVVRESRPSAT